MHFLECFAVLMDKWFPEILKNHNVYIFSVKQSESKHQELLTQ